MIQFFKVVVMLLFVLIALGILFCPLYFAFAVSPIYLLLFVISWFPAALFASLASDLTKNW
jgi:hypothetical protein